MTKMKKLFAVVLALAMLMTMATFSASAEGEEPVSLTVSPSAVNYNGGMRVTLNVDDTRVGGVQTTITYEKDVVKLVSKSLTNTTNNTLANTILDDGNGNIKVVALGGGVVFEFAVLESISDTTATFTATNVKASNLDGDGYVEVNGAALTANATISTDKTPMPVILGSRLRKTNNITNLHLGFDAQVQNLPEGASVTEVGIIVIPSAILTAKNVNPENFTLENTDLEGKVASAKLTGEDAKEFTKEGAIFTGYIKDTTSVELMGKSFTGRFYIKWKDAEDKETTVYSTNFQMNETKTEMTASYGVVKKSAVKLLGMYAKQIAANTDNTTIQDGAAKVISDYNATKSNDAKKALINFVFDNRTLIKK